MEVVFLGTGGGRFNLIKQIRATGGFRINTDVANIHVDPGPGALVRSHQFAQDPLSIDCVIVSHHHTDHVSDAQVMVEAMTHYTLKKRGIFIGSKNTIEQNGISKWHQKLVATCWAAEPFVKKRFSTEKGEFEIEILPMKHGEPTTFGFKLYVDKVLGYISDTEFQDWYGEKFQGCDLLIINCSKYKPDKYGGHLTVADTIAILKEAKPKIAVITHLGMTMLNNNPEKIAEKVAEESGVRVIAAHDGMRLELNGQLSL